MNVLCVCTFNQTRSVMMASLIAHHAQRADMNICVASAGLDAAARPPTRETVRLLADHGLDAATHVSRRVDAETASAADLIVTAEKGHVVEIAGQWPSLFARTFTMPELVRRAVKHAPRGEREVSEWLAEISVARPISVDYLDAAEVGEIEDPTGEHNRAWRRTFTQIDALAAELVRSLR